ncbi:hypothetical protein [Streptomyces crystallinus]|uniref:Uncharacterized protein n=1 Tax=Streptomyces crystallinus TaxID=68191 RepID=A0ABN1GRK9_9ACTN
MARPPHLCADDYSAQDLKHARALVEAALGEWGRLIRAVAPDGRWQPDAVDLVDQLGEVDALLDAMYRSIGTLRTGIRQLDSQAIARVLDRARSGPPASLL